nr:MAG TPA: hypothetical protein [Caudoviricetes sp.]
MLRPPPNVCSIFLQPISHPHCQALCVKFHSFFTSPPPISLAWRLRNAARSYALANFMCRHITSATV